jgi:hypothetical protein
MPGMRPDRSPCGTKVSRPYLVPGSRFQVRLGVLPVEHPDTQFWHSSTIEVGRNRVELGLGKQPSTRTNHLGLKNEKTS